MCPSLSRWARIITISRPGLGGIEGEKKWYEQDLMAKNGRRSGQKQQQLVNWITTSARARARAKARVSAK